MHVVGTAGHVDHGKSTLVRALTGIDPDRLQEEKRRGLTIDLGFAWLTLPSGREVGIVDVPGHERFVRNMLAGTGSIDVALFVVAADEGWMPQSAEHLLIIDLLGVRGGVVVLTKSDLVPPETLELVREDVRAKLRGTCLHSARVVAVSATTGEGLDELTAALDEVLGATAAAPDAGRPRLFVDRSFTIQGAGTVVTGTLTGGELRAGEVVEIVPDGVRARIRSLQTHRREVDLARPGSRVAANLVGLRRGEVERGDAVTRPGTWPVTGSFAARLRAADGLGYALTERGAYELYLGSAETSCEIKFLEERSEAIVAVNTGSTLSAGLRPGSSLLVQIFCVRRLPAAVGDRFVVRDLGRRATVAGGLVVDPSAGAIRRGDEDQLRRLRAREGLDGADLAARILGERGFARLEDLAAAVGAALDALPGAEAAADGYVLAPGRTEGLLRAALDEVRSHRDTDPLSPGLPVEDLRRALGVPDALLAWLLDRWERAGHLTRDRSVVRPAGTGTELPQASRAAADAALERLRAGGSSPPSLPDAGLEIGLAKLLERSGELVFVAPDIAYPSEVFDDLARRVAVLIKQSGPVTVSQARAALGTSRKYALPVLQRLDATGVTRRKGDVRELGPRGRELAG